MYTMENYIWGLVGYVVGATLVMWYLHWLFKRIPWHYLRVGLNILFATLLFTPVVAYPDHSTFLAPAFVVALFEGAIFDTDGGAIRSLLPMVFVFFTLVILYGGWQWWRGGKNTNPGRNT